MHHRCLPLRNVSYEIRPSFKYRAGIRCVAETRGIDTDQRNPTSRLLTATAEFERDLIQERVNSGRAEYALTRPARSAPGNGARARARRIWHRTVR
jgi:DNA invertase Pin-like site-specific DNA recombinase